MSTYYEIDISSTMHSEIESAILTAIQNTDNVWEIIELVHLVDCWENLKEEASAKNNENYRRWLEQQRLFEKKEVDDIFMYYEIKKIVDGYFPDLNPESEFHFVCDLADLFQKKFEETAKNE